MFTSTIDVSGTAPAGLGSFARNSLSGNAYAATSSGIFDQTHADKSGVYGFYNLLYNDSRGIVVEECTMGSGDSSIKKLFGGGRIVIVTNTI